ncbi:MAG: hypothetical protein U0353_16310 [Sandaracinus sp.]
MSASEASMAGNTRLPLVPSTLAPDNLTLAETRDEQDVSTSTGPYRDGADTKLTRARNLEAWLARLSEAESMRGALEREHALLEESIRHERGELLARVRTKTSCRERWDEMTGDDATRRCDRCRREVHDLSRLSRTEIERLFAREERGEVRLYRRADGRVTTGEGPRTARTQLLGAAATGAITGATIAGAFVGSYALVDDARYEAMDARMSFDEAQTHRAVLAQRAQGETVAAVQTSLREHEILEGRIHTDLARASVLAPVEAPSPTVSPEQPFDVVSLGSDEYLVSRPTLLPEPTAMMSAARLIPHERDGVVLGVRIFGIRREALLARLGLQNGDTLVSVNGVALATIHQHLDTFASIVRDSTAIELVLLRRGEVVRLHYTVVG